MKLFKKKKTLKITGFENKLVLFDDDNIEYPLKNLPKGLTININGNNNVIKIHKDTKFVSSFIQIGNDNCDITIGKSDLLSFNLRCCFGEGQFFKIGNGTQIGQASFFLDEKSGVEIGKNCMFSNDVTVWATDGHGIIDLNENKIINSPKEPVVIGNHVWIGFGATILKESKISDNSILGAKSVLAKKINEENVVIAGNPAKIIRRNINWSHESLFMTENKNH